MSVHTDVHTLLHVTSLALLTTGGPWSLPISLQLRLTEWNLFLHRLDVCSRSAYMYSSYLLSKKHVVVVTLLEFISFDPVEVAALA